MVDERPRVFVVEDEFLIAFEMADTLESMGISVAGPYVHFEEAKKAAREEMVDAALLDVNLGGGKTSEPIAEIFRERGIPFVFVTAYDRREITFVLSDDRVVRKPVTPDVLLEALREVYPQI
ncbi:response regulator [Sphingomicrobium sp. XHP0239]|uniref:response regulator n=1 Tax=Sphingomicrobium maritimum TaxID=3133972 RepID=UPI0031CCAAE5